VRSIDDVTGVTRKQHFCRNKSGKQNLRCARATLLCEQVLIFARTAHTLTHTRGKLIFDASPSWSRACVRCTPAKLWHRCTLQKAGWKYHFLARSLAHSRGSFALKNIPTACSVLREKEELGVLLLFYAPLCKCVVFVLLQNVLRELEQKKPQLDELVHTAEHLKADSNRQQLHGKGEYISPLFFCHFAREMRLFLSLCCRVFSMRCPRLLQTHPLPFVLVGV
jgi:hypothetical protein